MVQIVLQSPLLYHIMLSPMFSSKGQVAKNGLQFWFKEYSLEDWAGLPQTRFADTEPTKLEGRQVELSATTHTGVEGRYEYEPKTLNLKLSKVL